jgi:hypothetical protein
MTLLRCADGNHDLPRENFTAAQLARRGTFRLCRECIAKRSAALYLRNKPKVQARCKAWHDAHRQRRAMDHRRRRYGISVEHFEAMMAEQSGACAICRRQLVVAAGRTPATAHVDHDHRTGHIRSLLCNACNTVIGLARENPSVLCAAAEYVKKHAAEAA